MCFTDLIQLAMKSTDVLTSTRKFHADQIFRSFTFVMAEIL